MAGCAEDGRVGDAPQRKTGCGTGGGDSGWLNALRPRREDGRVSDAAPTQDEDAACTARMSQSRRLHSAGSGQGSGASAGARLADVVTAFGDPAPGYPQGAPLQERTRLQITRRAHHARGMG